MVQKELLDKVQGQLTAAEEALAAKQGKIDHMKQEIFQKEKELETISVFQAQVSKNIVLTPHVNRCVLSAVCSFLSLCFFSACRRRCIPQTSTQSEQQGRSSTRRGSAWLHSWSM